MTKNEAFKQFSQSYNQLLDTQKEDFSKIALKLLDDTFLVKEKESDSKDYLKAKELFDVLNPYFAFMDFVLVCDNEKGVIYIRTELDSNRVRLKKLETITALILRFIYDEEASKTSLTTKVTTTVSRIASEIVKTDIYPNFDGRGGDFREALKVLRRYKLIDYTGDLSIGTTSIVIFRSIVLIVDTNSIEELKERISRYQGGPQNETNQEVEID